MLPVRRAAVNTSVKAAVMTIAVMLTGQRPPQAAPVPRSLLRVYRYRNVRECDGGGITLYPGSATGS
jgi:hypothetical protein